MQSPGKKCERCKPSWTFYAQLAACPLPVNPNELEEDRGYYPPEPEYIPSYEETIQILVARKNRSEQQMKKEEEERIENRRIVEGIDYHSDLDTIYQDYI